mmetsp:Transcript_22977/g.36111  ORF Transcript_22977/g.36111 Transcript_22977/m.36111 type:complete len:272 (+) Transcript_22977:505-1320(+)
MPARISAAATSFSFTSFTFALVAASTLMSSVSSSRFPLPELRRSSRMESSCSSALVLAVTSSTTLFSCSSRLRCSFWITMPRSCSSSPFCVTVKSIIVVFAWSSGEKCGLGRRVTRYSAKSSWYSHILSASVTYFVRALTTICFSSTGLSMGSSSCSTPATISARPSAIAYSSWSRSLGCPSVVVPKGGRRSASWLRIQVSAWPWGSTSRGKRELRVTSRPFWMESESVGSPSRFQSPITPTSTKKDTISCPGVTGTSRSLRSLINFSWTR